MSYSLCIKPDIHIVQKWIVLSSIKYMSPKIHVCSEPENVALFGSRDFCRCNQVKMRLYWI